MPDLSLDRGSIGAEYSSSLADEAGRGPLAGPVVAAAVILPPDLTETSRGSSSWMILVPHPPGTRR